VFDNNTLAAVAPMPGEAVFEAVPGDKFFDSNLDYILKQANTKTVVMTGVLANAGIMYTAAGAIQRGYTVVVAEDGINGANDFATSVALWQMLNGLPVPAARVTRGARDPSKAISAIIRQASEGLAEHHQVGRSPERARRGGDSKVSRYGPPP